MFKLEKQKYTYLKRKEFEKKRIFTTEGKYKKQ